MIFFALLLRQIGKFQYKNYRENGERVAMGVAIETARLLIRNFTLTDWAAFQKVILHYQASASDQYEPRRSCDPLSLLRLRTRK